MDGVDVFVKGIILGFAIAAPVGPIGVLCIRRTLQRGRWSGLFSGLGAAVADTMYGVIALFGLDLLSDFLIAGQLWLRVLGGIFLIFLGLRTFFIQPRDPAKLIVSRSLIRDFISTFLLTLTNPLTVFSYLAIFAGIGIMQNVALHGKWLISGVFLGSAFWWLLLSEGVSLFRKRVSHKFMAWVNRIAGIAIMGFGLAALISTYFI